MYIPLAEETDAQPHIVQFYDSFEEQKEYDITRYIVMEFVEGGTLHEFIQRSDQLSEATVQHIIRQVLAALEYMHDRVRVSHRDLKPAVPALFVWMLSPERSFMQEGVVSPYQNRRSRACQDRSRHEK
jgi:serine/threonine protein kinase